MELEYGVTYYRITYADVHQTMPGVEPMVYVGENIFGDEKGHTYYFQDTVSVKVHGLFEEADEEAHCRFMSCVDEELGGSLVDIDGVAIAVTGAATRFKEKGEPKLRHLPGNWVSE